MKKFKKLPLKEYKKLGMYPVYSTSLYNGHEPLKIIGIRENQVELEGDFSGGTHPVKQKDWFNDEDCYVVKEACEETLKPNGCQIHNVNCCGGGYILTTHMNKYWENLINNYE